MARISEGGLAQGERRRLSIPGEVALIRQALDGIRLLVELGEGQLVPDAKRAPAAAVAIAVIVGQRLRAVERAASGDIDPAELIHRENEVWSADGGAQLAPWSVGQRQKEAERQLRRLQVGRSSARSRRRR